MQPCKHMSSWQRTDQLKVCFYCFKAVFIIKVTTLKCNTTKDEKNTHIFKPKTWLCVLCGAEIEL